MQELRQRIRDSYEARWKAEKHFDEDQILNEMPGSLRIEVSHASLLTTFQHANSHGGSCNVMTVHCTLSLNASDPARVSLNSLMVVQVCMHTCAELIASVPFLEDAEDDFVRYLVTQLHPTV